MRGKKITETALELFIRANGDIKGIEGYIKEEDFDENNRAYGAYHAQQMAEKLLKGYLIYKNKEPEWGHNLIEYYNDALKTDKSFKNLENEIHHLNTYKAGIKYSTKIDVDEKKFVRVLEDIKTVYNFYAFQNIYDEFVNNKLCKKIKIYRFDKMIADYDYILNGSKMREIDFISHKHFENHEESRLSVKNGYLDDIHDIKGLISDKVIEEKLRKLTYKRGDNQKIYFLERIYKNNEDGILKSDLWEIRGNFSDLNALAFVKFIEKNQAAPYSPQKSCPAH